MSALGFVAAVGAGAVLLLSGAGKLRDRRGFVSAVLEYDVLPSGLAVAYGRLLPWAEVACGLALVCGILPVVAGAFACLLFLSFLVGVGINLRRGRRLDCHCFGARHAEPIGWVTVVRLVALLASAALAGATRGRSVVVLPPPDAAPAALLAATALTGLYLLRAAPAQWDMWRVRATPGATMRRGCVSFRNAALEPQEPRRDHPNVATVHETSQEVRV